MAFKRLMTELFEGSNIKELIQRRFAHNKMQVENLPMPKSCFTLDQIMHLTHQLSVSVKLALTLGSSYFELPKGDSLEEDSDQYKN